MKASEVRELSADELTEKKGQLLEELFNLRFQNTTNQLENTARLAEVKKDIARIETISNERDGVEAVEEA